MSTTIEIKPIKVSIKGSEIKTTTIGIKGKDGSDAPKIHSGLDLDDGTNPHGTTKEDVGLGNVDDTSDADKPISNATQIALGAKLENVGVSDLKSELKATFETQIGSLINEREIDWSLGIACYKEMTADTVFTLANIVENKVMTFELKGEHAFTITGATILNPSVFSEYNGTVWNLFHVLPTSKGVYVSLIKEG